MRGGADNLYSPIQWPGCYKSPSICVHIISYSTIQAYEAIYDPQAKKVPKHISFFFFVAGKRFQLHGVFSINVVLRSYFVLKGEVYYLLGCAIIDCHTHPPPAPWTQRTLPSTFHYELAALQWGAGCSGKPSKSQAFQFWGSLIKGFLKALAMQTLLNCFQKEMYSLFCFVFLIQHV